MVSAVVAFMYVRYCVSVGTQTHDAEADPTSTMLPPLRFLWYAMATESPTAAMRLITPVSAGMA